MLRSICQILLPLINMGHIYQDELSSYLEAMVGLEDTLQQYREGCLEAGMPILEKNAEKLLEMLIRMNGSKKILEIGTCWGYSAAAMKKAGGEDCRIMTIEKDEMRHQEAKKRLQNYDEIYPVVADAGMILEELRLKGAAAPYPVTPPYDLVFLDGPKAHYCHYVDTIYTLLKPGGLLVADNVLYQGLVSTYVPAKHRKITIVKRLRRFLKKITTEDKWESVVLAVCDGLSISIKNKRA